MRDKRLNFFLDFFYQIYSYREYLKQSVLRDLRTKYKRSSLGYLWTMLNPLAMMGILAIVFSHIMRIAIKDYAVFLFTGLLAWNYFNSTAVMSIANIRNNARLIGQIPVPKYLFIVSLTFSNLINFLLAIVPLLIIMLIFGRSIPPTVLLFPLVLLPLYFVTAGLSLVLATSNVFFDDTTHLAEVALQALYFLSPVLYFRDLLPKGLINYLVLNPLFCQVEFMHDIFYEGRIPDLATFGVNFCASLAILAIGLFIFRRAEDKFLYFI
jgi:ABC-type polysaccharide/polyol phosphate export permease